MGKDKLFADVAIIGVGLIGGSLASVLKNRGLAGKVIGAGRSKPNMDKALELGIIDQALPATKAVADADLVVLCGPALSIIPTLKEIAPNIKNGALVTDVGSSKAEIVRSAMKVANGNFSFIGSHPIAGTEKSGAENSFETLFDNHKCIITPLDDSKDEDIEKLKKLWETAGMEIISMSPESHDRVFSAVSHLPHMVVFALVNAVCDMDEEEELLKFTAGGFKDFTRIASSPPEMWGDVALSNSANISKQIAMVKDQLTAIEKAISDRDKETLMNIFKKSNNFRNKIQ